MKKHRCITSRENQQVNIYIFALLNLKTQLYKASSLKLGFVCILFVIGGIQLTAEVNFLFKREHFNPAFQND